MVFQCIENKCAISPVKANDDGITLLSFIIELLVVFAQCATALDIVAPVLQRHEGAADTYSCGCAPYHL